MVLILAGDSTMMRSLLIMGGAYIQAMEPRARRNCRAFWGQEEETYATCPSFWLYSLDRPA